MQRIREKGILGIGGWRQVAEWVAFWSMATLAAYIGSHI